MGRMIDADVLREEVNSWGMNDYEPSDFTDAIDDAPTVEAIPKADYEKRLKADMVVMLTELKTEIEGLIVNTTITQTEFSNDSSARFYNKGIRMATTKIQQKINELKEVEYDR